MQRIKHQLMLNSKFFTLALILIIALGLMLPYTSSARAELSLTKTAQAIFKQFDNKNWSAGLSQGTKIKNDVILAKLIAWWYLVETDHKTSFKTLKNFISNNPDWPLIYKLREKAEKNLPSDLPAADVIAWFKLFKPRTIDGLTRYLDALIYKKNISEAKKILAEKWPSITLSRAETKKLARKYKKLFTSDAHYKRYDRLIWRGRRGEAKYMTTYITSQQRKLGEARIKLATLKNDVDQAIGKVPKILRNDPALQFERLRWRRKKNLDTRAIQILDKLTVNSKLPHAKKWWKERHILVRRLIEEHHYQAAYKLASNHKQTTGFAKAQAEWVSGWVALTYLNQAKPAFKHFERLYHSVSSPISKARATYWMARALETQGKTADATAWYQESAKYIPTFYGQLAAQKLNNAVMRTSFRHPLPSLSEKQTFNKLEFVHVIQWLEKLGKTEQSDLFFRKLIDTADTPMDFVLIGDLATQVKQYNFGVKSAKKLYYADDIMMLNVGYPDLRPLNTAEPEVALVHALIRQESGFDQHAKSPSGAQGLMQLMPATAREVAKKNNVRYNYKKLTQDPQYNIFLGANYLAHLLKRYDGAYVLAIAAYNAGPSRVNRWIKEFGDPRQENIDMITWVERIPIYETRNYVQRVLEGLYMYQIRYATRPKTLFAYK